MTFKVMRLIKIICKVSVGKREKFEFQGFLEFIGILENDLNRVELNIVQLIDIRS